MMQTFADYLRQEGHQTGLQEGHQTGYHQAGREYAKKMLNKGLDYEFIKEITQMTTDELEQLQDVE